MRIKLRAKVLLYATAGFCVFSGCAKKPMIKEASLMPQAPEPDKTPEQEDIEASLRGKDFMPTKELGVIHFDLDTWELRADMRAVAENNADFLKTHPNVEIRVDGHCDERGTTEYNLALGQRRAAAIRAYYKSLGVEGRRMASQSWGEEKLSCQELTDDCHYRNRRAETLARVDEELKPKAPKGKKKSK